jgi:hypothetical protein
MATRKIEIPLQPLIDRNEDTFLTATASSTTLTVKSISGFAINQNLLIGELGNEETEVIKTHAATAPTGSTITLVASLVRSHPVYTKVRILTYDQVEYSHATTTTGTKTVMATQTISGNKTFDYYNDSTYTTGYYFTRFKNSITSVFSDYSDPIPYAGKAINSVGYAIDYALSRNNAERSEKLTDKFFYEEINSCLNYITGKRKKWSQLQNFDYVLGQTSMGTYSYTLPTDIYDTNSNRSILDVRIGTGTSLAYKDKKEWEEELTELAVTGVTTQAVAAATTLYIDNSYDFADTGSVNVYISGTSYTLTYTGITRSATAGALTGIPASGDGSITVTIPAATKVFQNDNIGTPLYYTVFGGNLLVYPFPDSDSDDMNVVLDYWTQATMVDSDGDTLDIFRYDLVKDWLTWVIRAQLKNDGKRDVQDPDYMMFQDKLNDYMRMERTGQKYKMSPKLNQINP